MTKPTTLDDIAESIADMTTMIAREFTAVRQEMATKEEMAVGFTELRREMATKQEMHEEIAALRREMASSFAEVHKRQREASQSLEHLETASETLVNDVRDMYALIGDLRADFKDLTKDQGRRLADLEAFAMQVAEKTGIPFTRKPKLRS